MASSFHSAQAFIVSQLSTHQLRAYEQPAPSTATMPFIAYDLTPQNDTQAKDNLVWARMDAVVRVVGRGSPWPLGEHIEAIESLLDGASGDSYGNTVSLRRSAPFRLPPYYREGDNQPTQEIGLRFAVRVKPVEVSV